jgi:hypothetical protein
MLRFEERLTNSVPGAYGLKERYNSFAAFSGSTDRKNIALTVAAGVPYRIVIGFVVQKHGKSGYLHRSASGAAAVRYS